MPFTPTLETLRRQFRLSQPNLHGLQISRRAFLKGAIAIAALATVTAVNPWVARASLTLAVKSYGGTLGQVGSACTGTIGAGSTSLVVNAVPANMAVLDWVIVETGGEAGLGARGTRGVGGQWPATLYADAATMNADTSQANNTWAGLIDTGVVYRWKTSTSTWVAPPSSSHFPEYYSEKINPKSLRAQITNISGTTVTLSVAATIATTNANVYCDNTPYLDNIFANPGSAETDFIIPSGTFACGDTVNIEANHDGLDLRGTSRDASELFSPKGVRCITIFTAAEGDYHDFAIRGNARFEGFYFSNEAVTGEPSIFCGLRIEGGGTIPILNSSVYNFRGTDTFHHVLSYQYSTNCTATNVDVVLTQGVRMYTGWFVEAADSTGAVFTNITFDSPTPTRFLQGFRSDDMQVVGVTSNNGTIGFNSCGDWTLDLRGCTVEIDPQLATDATSFPVGIPIIDINSNIQPPNAQMNLGGTIYLGRIIQNGVHSVGGRAIKVINIDINNPNVSVLGDYPDCSATDGVIEWGPGGTPALQTQYVNSTAPNTTVDGVRVAIPYTLTFFGAIQSTGANCITRNCIADRFNVSGTGSTQVNNKTNAQWTADCANTPRKNINTSRRRRVDIPAAENGERQLSTWQHR